MSVQLIVVTTRDGFIARNESENTRDWGSREDMQRFIALTKAARAVVMGRKTFATIGKALPGRLIMVYSQQPGLELPSGVEQTKLPPRELLEHLRQRGYPDVAICGGAEIYDLFLREDLIDEIFLTVEPVTFGSGIRLFKDDGYFDRFLLEKSLNGNDKGTVFRNYLRK